MRFPRRHRKTPDALGAAEQAAQSRERAEADLGHQQAAAHEERREVVAPLRRMRERNHLSEAFIESIRRGYGHR